MEGPPKKLGVTHWSSRLLATEMAISNLAVANIWRERRLQSWRTGSWLNMVEIFFGIITRQAIRRGSFRSVHELTSAIRRFIDAYNDRARPFVWTKTADQILAHAKPGRR